MKKSNLVRGYVDDNKDAILSYLVSNKHFIIGVNYKRQISVLSSANGELSPKTIEKFKIEHVILYNSSRKELKEDHFKNKDVFYAKINEYYQDISPIATVYVHPEFVKSLNILRSNMNKKINRIFREYNLTEEDYNRYIRISFNHINVNVSVGLVSIRINDGLMFEDYLFGNKDIVTCINEYFSTQHMASITSYGGVAFPHYRALLELSEVSVEFGEKYRKLLLRHVTK